ncbi:MAG: hypothetical protein ACQESA_00185 [Patescibacteria group bacterium]
MDTIMKADIFFFVTTVAVAIISLLAIVASIYMVFILKNIFYISKKARQQTDQTVEDISTLRQAVKEEALKLKKDTDDLSGRAKSEGEEAINAFSEAHKEVKKEAKRFWGLFTFLLSFLTIKSILKVFNKNKNDQKSK